MAYGRIAAVTGANKGVGLGIVRQLALKYPTSPFQSGPLLIYLLSRDSQRGEAALTSILEDPKLKDAKALSQDGGLADVRLRALDISDSDSVQSFASFVRKEHPEGIDYLINNAGVAMDGFNAHVVETTLRCNYWGTLEMTETFLPMMRPGGRIVNVASTAGLLNKYGDPVKRQFVTATKVDQITELMEDFIRHVKEGTHQQHGWPTNASYAVSKAGLIGATRIISREEHGRGRGVLVSVCCPGLVATDMTKHRGTRGPDEGARTPVMLALEDVGDRPGAFWRHEEVISWDPTSE